jgi:hypothetical protein
MSTQERSDRPSGAQGLPPAEPSLDIDTTPMSSGPAANWTTEEWEIYRLQRDNADLRAQVDRLSGSDAAHRHALRWGAIMSTVGVLLVLAIVLPSPAGTVCWALLAADILGLAAYGITMDNRAGKKG